MLKLFKWLAGLLVTLTILILLAAIIIPNVIDPNDYKDDLAVLVKEKTGRELSLNGDLKVSVFPWLGVKTQGLTLSQPSGIDGDMVSVDSAQLRVKLMPLLSRKVEIDTVLLERPMIKLVTLKNGLDSFSGLSVDAAPEEVEEDSATAAVALAIQGIELTDGAVVIDDRQVGSLLELSKLNLVTGNLIGVSLADINATGELKDSSSPDITKLDLSAKALINTDTFDLQASDILARVQQGEFDIEIALEAMTFKQSSQIDVSGLNFALKGEQSVEASMPKLVANLDTQTAVIESLSANYENVKALISNVKVSKFIDQPSATGRFAVPAFDARELVKALELDFQPSDPNVLKSVALNADFAGSLEGASIQNLVVNLDDTALTGSASVMNFENPKLKFDLSLSDLNLDSYLPEETEEEEEVSGGEALAVPMAVFKDIHANGTFKASKLISSGVVLTDIDVVVKSTPGNVSITPRASLYEGKLDGAIVFNDSGDKSSLSVKNEIDLVQLSPLLRDAIESDMLRGIGTLGLDLVVTEVNGVQSNEGTIKLRAKQGALSGIDVYNIAGKLNSAASLYNSLSSEDQASSEDAQVEGKKSDSTEFSELLGTFYLKDFLMTNDDLKFNGPGFEITGAGQFDLEKENIDYRVNLIIQKSIDGVVGNEFQKILGPKTLKWLSGKQIPIRCKGSFESPVCIPDLKALYSFYLSSKLNDKKSDLLQEKLGVKTQEGEKVRTKDLLKQLLINKATKGDDQDQAVERPVEDIGQVPQNLKSEPQKDDSAEAANEDEPQRPTKDQLKDDLKKKLLESIFN